jgi:hypothetical protein
MMLDRLTVGADFHDNAFVADLDVRFAAYWFAAYSASGDKPRAWAPLFSARKHRGVLPIQFALAGINAHIEHDLPLAVIDTCTARKRTPNSPGVHEDYEKVSEWLATIEADLRPTARCRPERANSRCAFNAACQCSSLVGRYS